MLANHIGSSPPQVEKIFVNGHIITMDEDIKEVQALAVGQGKILSIGTTEEIDVLLGMGSAETLVLAISSEYERGHTVFNSVCKGDTGMLKSLAPDLQPGHLHYVPLFNSIKFQISLHTAETGREPLSLHLIDDHLLNRWVNVIDS